MDRPHPTVAALMVVRNEQQIVASAIGHLLTTVGVDRIYVVDNGSIDRTPDILRRIALGTGRVTVDFDPGAFLHADIVTALARRAAADGAHWVLPTDADEFLWLRPGTSLATLCGRDGIGGYRIPMCNFLQARPVRHDGPNALVTMCVAAIPTGSVADGHARVSAGEIPFMRTSYPPKLLLRATPSLRIAFGNHDAAETAGPLIQPDEAELLHAPIRSPACLRRRVEAGRRTEIVTPEPGQNWHLKRLIPMDPAALGQEWRQNSFAPLWPVRPGATRLDTRLSRVGLRQAGFSRRFTQP